MTAEDILKDAFICSGMKQYPDMTIEEAEIEWEELISQPRGKTFLETIVGAMERYHLSFSMQEDI